MDYIKAPTEGGGGGGGLFFPLSTASKRGVLESDVPFISHNNNLEPA